MDEFQNPGRVPRAAGSRVVDLVQPGRARSARAGACSITRATAPRRLLPGTSHAIGKHHRGRRSAPASRPSSCQSGTPGRSVAAARWATTRRSRDWRISGPPVRWGLPCFHVSAGVLPGARERSLAVANAQARAAALWRWRRAPVSRSCPRGPSASISTKRAPGARPKSGLGAGRGSTIRMPPGSRGGFCRARTQAFTAYSTRESMVYRRRLASTYGDLLASQMF